METNNEIWSGEEPTFGPPQYYNNIIYVCILCGVCVSGGRDREEEELNAVHAMCSHIIIIRNLNASSCVCPRARVYKEIPRRCGC